MISRRKVLKRLNQHCSKRRKRMKLNQPIKRNKSVKIPNQTKSSLKNKKKCQTKVQKKGIFLIRANYVMGLITASYIGNLQVIKRPIWKKLATGFGPTLNKSTKTVTTGKSPSCLWIPSLSDLMPSESDFQALHSDQRCSRKPFKTLWEPQAYFLLAT